MATEQSKIIFLVVIGVVGMIYGIFAKSPAVMLIPAFLLGKAYRLHKANQQS